LRRNKKSFVSTVPGFVINWHLRRLIFFCAKWCTSDEACPCQVRRIRDQFYPKTALNPDRVIGLDVIVRDAVNLKCTAAPLREIQLKELIHILAHSV